jgi:hypothetical protein
MYMYMYIYIHTYKRNTHTHTHTQTERLLGFLREKKTGMRGQLPLCCGVF